MRFHIPVPLFAPSHAMVLALALCLPVLLGGPGAKAAPATLRFTSAYMDRHPAYMGAFVPWMQALEQATGGELRVRYFNPNTLCPEAGMFDAVAAGAVDMAANAHGRTPGRFPRMGVLDLPMLMPDAIVGSVISQQIYHEWPSLQEESSSARMLWHYVSAPHILHTKKPVTSLEDLKGMKIIAWAPLGVDVLRALGANPIQSVPHDSYLAVQRGMADGVLCPLSTLRSFKISEAVSHTTMAPLMVDSFWVAISPQLWDALTPRQQELLGASVADMPRITGQALHDGSAAEAAILEAAGHTLHTLSPGELARWEQALAPLYDRWLADMDKRGVTDAPDLLARVRAMVEEKQGE